MNKKTLKQVISEWIDTELTDVLKDKLNNETKSILQLYVMNLIQEERNSAANLVIDFAGSDERWIAEEIRRGTYGE